jgi:hypothetical protein
MEEYRVVGAPKAILKNKAMRVHRNTGRSSNSHMEFDRSCGRWSPKLLSARVAC